MCIRQWLRTSCVRNLFLAMIMDSEKRKSLKAVIIVIMFMVFNGCGESSKNTHWDLDATIPDAGNKSDSTQDIVPAEESNLTEELYCERKVADDCAPEQVGQACNTGCAGRCSSGLLKCIDGTLVCRAQFRAMPELCNNLDDDCDGMVDNISESWSRAIFEDIAAGPINNSAGACYRKSESCMCSHGMIPEHQGEGDSILEEFRAFKDLNSLGDNGCYCLAN